MEKKDTKKDIKKDVIKAFQTVGGKIAGGAKAVVRLVKENKQIDIIVGFGLLTLALILVGTLGLKQPVVPVCLALILEALIAMMLHNVELWVHGIAVAVQLAAGFLIQRGGLMVCCVILYVLAIFALLLWDRAAKRRA